MEEAVLEHCPIASSWQLSEIAIFELGVPAGILGAAVGAAAGIVTGRLHRIKVP